MKPSQSSFFRESRNRRRRSGFTMIEIALCLAIIGFALVAIIGVLPTGLNVQRDNREETIINQDAVVWMDAIRGGARGCDDLTNYVVAITNRVQDYRVTAGTPAPLGAPDIFVFTRSNSLVNGSPMSPQFILNRGERIIGLLSKPKIEWYGDPNGPNYGFRSNFIIAIVRAFSGTAVDKMPQQNVDVLESAFAYRMVSEVVPYVPFEPRTINVFEQGLTSAELEVRTNNWRTAQALWSNMHDVRLLFRWPVAPNGVGNGRQTFRSLVGGQMITLSPIPSPDFILYFLQSGTYTNAGPYYQ